MRQTILQQAARISKSKTGKIDLLTLWLRRLLVWLVPIVRARLSRNLGDRICTLELKMPNTSRAFTKS